MSAPSFGVACSRCLTSVGSIDYPRRMSIVPTSRALVLLTLVSLAATAWPQEVRFPPKPDPESFYVDMASVVAEMEGKEINEVARTLLQEERMPLLVVTIPSLTEYGAAGYTIERYATALFNEWGIGSEERNYGMLLLVAVGDRKARIELGAGWGLGHDRQAQEIMASLIIPPFKRRAYSEGILAGVRGLDAMARGLALPKPEAPWWALPLMIGFVVLIVFVIYSLFKSGQRGWGWALIAFLGVALFFLLRSAASGGGSGGSFGGGFSGGGGASGSW